MDEKILWKLSDLALKGLYEHAQVTAHAARLMVADKVMAEGQNTERIEVLVSFSGNIADLQAAGLESAIAIRGPDGINIGDGKIAPAHLGRLAAIPHVLSVESRPETRSLLDNSTKDVGVDELRATIPDATGKGVVIAIVDGDIDWSHDAFTKREPQPNGTTRTISRILALWARDAQVMDPSERSGPTGGVVYTKEDIERALQKQKTLHKGDDKDGHGTHVAGIAAGGELTPQSPDKRGKYVGIAPEADIIFVRKTAGLIPALEFIRREVKGKPVVVNYSVATMGSGGRDGTTLIERAINAFVEGGPGRAVVVAAGNEGETERHYYNRNMPASGPLEVEFKVNSGQVIVESKRPDGTVNSETKKIFDQKPRGLEFWYPNGKIIHLQLISPSGNFSKLIPHGSKTHSFTLDEGRPPDAPALLTGSPGNKQVILSWDASNGAKYYDIFRRTGSTGTLERIKDDLTATNYIDGDSQLINNTSYDYVVRAKNKEGYSPDSNLVTVTPNDAPSVPPAPTNLTAIPGVARVTLTWDASSGATSYEVQRDTALSGTFEVISTLLTGTTYTDEGLGSSIAYRYVVRARNGIGAGPISSSAYTSPLGSPPPEPTLVRFTADNTRILVKWERVAGATSYEVRRRKNDTQSYVTIGVPTGTMFLDVGLENGTSYYYVVLARNRWGLGPPSSPAMPAIPAEPSNAPPGPAGFTAEAPPPGDRKVILSWNIEDRATEYEVRREEGASGQLLPVAVISDTTYTDDTVIFGKTYRYLLRAGNQKGWSSYVSAPPVTVVNTAPSAPKNFTAAAGNRQAILNWERSDGADSYEIWRDNGCANNFGTSPIASLITQTTYTDSDASLANGTSYCYLVKARNNGGASPASNIQSATPSATLAEPSKPIDFKVESKFNILTSRPEIRLTWRASPNATSYAIKRSTTQGVNHTRVGQTKQPLFTDDSKLDPGKRYYYVVVASNSSGSSSSDEKEITFPSGKEVSVKVAVTLNHSTNNDNLINIALSNEEFGLPPGNWRLLFHNPSAADVIDLHGWITSDDVTGDRIAGPKFLRPTVETTLTIPATARGAISVANYVGPHRGECSGRRHIRRASSRGPVRETAVHTELDPGPGPKPDLAAPGTAIKSAIPAAGTLPGVSPNDQVDTKSGTSQAAPHVTGAIALMLQKDSTLTNKQIVQFLRRSARQIRANQDPNAWGAGLLNVKQAVEDVIAAKLKSSQASSPDPLTASGPEPNALVVVGSVERDGSTPLTSIVDVLRTQARTIPDGELCAAIISRHFSEARRLINTNKRVATMWHRGDGPMLLQRFIVGAGDGSAPAPILSDEQRNYLGLLLEQLKRYGSPSLQASIERYGEKIIQLLERPLAAQVVSQATQVTL